MNHIKALAIKFVSTLVVLFIILGLFYDMAFRNVFWISLVLTVAAYLIGDMLILPRTNNTIATIADFGLAFFVIWLMGDNLTYGASVFTPALITAAGVAIFEYFFHKYVSNRVINETKNETHQARNLRYQTEASEELSPNRTDLEKDHNDDL